MRGRVESRVRTKWISGEQWCPLHFLLGDAGLGAYVPGSGWARRCGSFPSSARQAEGLRSWTYLPRSHPHLPIPPKPHHLVQGLPLAPQSFHLSGARPEGAGAPRALPDPGHKLSSAQLGMGKRDETTGSECLSGCPGA